MEHVTWKLETTEDLAVVLELYRTVFGEELSRERIDEKVGPGRRLHLYLIRTGNQAPVGFGMFVGSGPDVEFWHGGVIPVARRQGAGTAMMEAAERELAHLGYTRMSVSTYNAWNIMLSLLVRRGFRVMGTQYSERRDDVKILLQKAIRGRKELRYSLTESCNFNCFFCHNEGLEKRHVPAPAPVDRVLQVLHKAVDLGHTDLTFTGGEPLLRKEPLRQILVSLGQRKDRPDVTLVTNGSRLDADVVSFLGDYPGKLKVHVSLHACDRESFHKVTGRDKFDLVKRNLTDAAGAGLTVKVNHVVLQGLNHHRVLESIEMARSAGASGIKFLELLVLASNPTDFKNYYDASAIVGQVEKVARRDSADLRRKRFVHLEDPSFLIEVQKLTCQLGCHRCREVRDRTISSDLRYHPCFVRSKKAFPASEASELATVFDKGDRIIDGFATKYGESSPTLLRKEKFVARRRECFFHVADPKAFAAFLSAESFELAASAGFQMEYYWPRLRSEDWTCFRRVVAIGWDNHDQSKADLIQTDHRHWLRYDGALEVETEYLFESGPIKFPSAHDARHFLDRMGFERHLALGWHLDTWRSKDCELNLSTEPGPATVRVAGDQGALEHAISVLGRYSGCLSPIAEPLLAFMAKHQGQ